MNLASEQIIKEINRALAILTTNIKLDTHINLTDKAQIAEKIFGELFTIIFKSKFSRADIVSLNHPSIDLISENTVFQVSTDATPEKIRNTVKTFKEKEYDKKYNKLKFLFISSRNPIGTSGRTNFGDLPINIFNPKDDIYYSDKLSSQIQRLEDNDIKEIKNILFRELGLDNSRQPFRWIKALDLELSITNKEKTSENEFENNLIYYTNQEQNLIDNFVTDIDFENKNTFLITGHPSTGKTTVAFDIAKRVQADENKAYYPFYIKIKASDNLSFSNFYEDLERIGINPAILVVDDIHLNFQLANELLSRSEKYSNIIFLFVSRFISKELRKDLYSETDDVFEILKSSKLSFEKFNSDEFYKEKLSGIIEKHKIYNQKKGNVLKIGNPLKIVDLTKKNLFKLRLILKDWNESNLILSDIDDSRLNQNLYSRFLNGLNAEEQKELMIYACLYSFEIPFSKSKQDDASEKDGLFFTEEINDSLFMHSSFSDLLIDAYLSRNKIDFKQLYNNEKDRFIVSNIKTYIHLFLSKEFCDYPENIYQIFYNLGINKTQWIFSELQNDVNSFQAIVSYFQKSDRANSEELKNILQLTKIFAKRNYEKLVTKLIIENERRAIVLKQGDNNLLTLSYAHYSIHPKNIALKNKLYEVFSDNELTDIIRNAEISKLTLAFKYLQNNHIRHRLTSLISKDEWVEIFNKVPFKLLGNSLTEIKTIDSELAFYIYNNLDEDFISSRIGKTPFDNITKTLSEINVLGNQKAKFILDKIPQENLHKSIGFVSISQIGIGLSRLKKIDKVVCENIAENLNSELLYRKLISSDLNDFGRVLVEINNVSESLATEILLKIKEDNPIEERFNSTNIKGKEISHILESLHKIGDKEYGLHLLKTAHPDIIYGRILSSSISIASHIIKSVGYFNKSLAEKYMDDYYETNLIEKLESKLILLTHLPNIFNDFSSVNLVKTQLFVSSLDNYLFVKKGLARAVNLPGLANTFNVLKKYNREKIEEIIINLNSHNIFKSKIKDCSAESFFGSVSIIHKLSPTVTDSMIKTYQEKLKSGKKVSIQFSQLCDALYRFGKIDKELAQKLIIDFKPLLIESYKNIGFRKLSSGLNTIGKLNKDFAQSLLRELPIEDLKNRMDNILNNENNINGALGEIRKVDEKIWKTLYEYANA
jgi:hypothetical protein